MNETHIIIGSLITMIEEDGIQWVCMPMGMPYEVQRQRTIFRMKIKLCHILKAKGIKSGSVSRTVDRLMDCFPEIVQ